MVHCKIQKFRLIIRNKVQTGEGSIDKDSDNDNDKKPLSLSPCLCFCCRHKVASNAAWELGLGVLLIGELHAARYNSKASESRYIFTIYNTTNPNLSSFPTTFLREHETYDFISQTQN